MRAVDAQLEEEGVAGGDRWRYRVADPKCTAGKDRYVDATCRCPVVDELGSEAGDTACDVVISRVRMIFRKRLDIELRVQSDVNTTIVHGGGGG